MITIPKKQTEGIRRISLDSICIVDNVRKNYDEADIIEMARSIEQGGMHQPIKVYEDDAPGYYNIIFGHRRYMAHNFLFTKEKKEFYATIDCIVATKPEFQNLRITQLVENWQRKSCTAQENETAINELKNTGMSNKEIAMKTGKSEQWVSSCLTAHEARLDLKNEGIETGPLSTPAMSSIGRLPKEQRAGAVQETIATGGSARAAEAVTRAKRGTFADEYTSTLDRVKTFINEKKAEGKIVSYSVTNDDEIIVRAVKNGR